jgi:hypothetical protein
MNHSDQSKSEPCGRRDEPGPGDDVACVNCGERALDTGLECDNCGFDNFEAVTGKPFPGRQQEKP